MAFIPALWKHEGTFSLAKPGELDGSRAERECTRRRKDSVSIVGSVGGNASESAGRASEMWRQIWRLDLFYFRSSPFSHFLWHLCFTTFTPHAGWSNTSECLSWLPSELSAHSKVTMQSELQSAYRHFSENSCRVQNIPHSCFEASKEHSCISSVSVLPATVYIAPGVCRAMQ